MRFIADDGNGPRLCEECPLSADWSANPDAIAAEYTLEEVVLRAIGAGADILLFGNNLEYDPAIVAKVQAVIVRAVEDGTISRARLEASWRRILKLKQQMS